MTGRWTFAPTVDEAERDPPLPDPAQLQPLREMLIELSQGSTLLNEFLPKWWPELLQGAGDPDAEYCGNGISFRVSGDEVIFTPLYDQWGDAGYVYVPLADVQDLVDQFATYVRAQS